MIGQEGMSQFVYFCSKVQGIGQVKNNYLSYYEHHGHYSYFKHYHRHFLEDP